MKPSGKWTSAGVRHRGPRWYWISRGDVGDDAVPGQLAFDRNRMTVDGYINGSWQTWEYWTSQFAYRRWSEPIAPPRSAP